jgi:hypothetical protein
MDPTIKSLPGMQSIKAEKGSTPIGALTHCMHAYFPTKLS